MNRLEENTAMANTTNTSKDRRTILLQTARVMAFGESSKKSIPVCILFDSGSQMFIHHRESSGKAES